MRIIDVRRSRRRRPIVIAPRRPGELKEHAVTSPRHPCTIEWGTIFIEIRSRAMRTGFFHRATNDGLPGMDGPEPVQAA